MSAVVRARYRTSCAVCREAIFANDNIVFVDDLPVHEECELSNGWDQHIAPATVILKQVLDRRPELMQTLLDADFDITRLPERIEQAMFELVAAEGTLRSLLEDVESEHRTKPEWWEIESIRKRIPPVQGGGIPLD